MAKPSLSDVQAEIIAILNYNPDDVLHIGVRQVQVKGTYEFRQFSMQQGVSQQAWSSSEIIAVVPYGRRLYWVFNSATPLVAEESIVVENDPTIKTVLKLANGRKMTGGGRISDLFA